MKRLLSVLLLFFWASSAHAEGLSLMGVGTIDGTISAQCSQFLSRIPAPTGARQGLYCGLIDSLVTAGVWSKLDTLYLLAAADQATALTNLKSSSYGATAVNTPTFTADQGFAGNGTTSYVNTNFNPSTAGGNYAQNSATMGVWDLTSRASNGSMAIGATNATSTIFSVLRPFHPAGAPSAFTNSDGGSAALNGSAGASSGLSTWNRSDASNAQVYRNGASAATSSAMASTGLPPVAVTIGAANLNGTIANFTTDTIAAAVLGGSLTSTEQLALYNALHTYLQAVAGVP